MQQPSEVEVPDWLTDLITCVCAVEDITPEQAARLLLVRGALWWEAAYFCRRYGPPAS